MATPRAATYQKKEEKRAAIAPTPPVLATFRRFSVSSCDNYPIVGDGGARRGRALASPDAEGNPMSIYLPNQFSMIQRPSITDPFVSSFMNGMEKVEGLMLPERPLRQPMKGVVIEGVLGAAARERYVPALRNYVRFGQLRVFGVDLMDLAEFDLSSGTGRSMNGGMTETLSDAGIVYLNKNRPEDLRVYENLIVDGVIVVTWDDTHCAIARKWLGRARWIFIEKPLDSTVQHIDAFETELNQYGGEVFPVCFDHWRTKALPLRQMIRNVLGWLGGAPEEVIFYLLEPQTIEQEGRVHALKRGVILDLFPHCMALLLFFGDPATLQLDEGGLKVGRYEGAEIDRETFAAIKFTFRSYDGKLVRGTAYVGKGVKAVRSLRRAGQIVTCAPPKLFEACSSNGRVIRLDFQKGSNTFSVEQDGEEKVVAGLIDPPHNLLVDSFVFNQLANHSCFSIQAGKVIVAKIGEILERVPKATIPSYRTSDYLEDILERV